MKEIFDYTSPITQIVSDMQMEYENGVLKAVQQYGFHVDKEELTKALVYDRGQYEKGYKDGYASAIDEFAEKLKDNIYPMSHGLGVHDIDIITEEMKNSCMRKTFREIDTDYIAEQLKEE